MLDSFWDLFWYTLMVFAFVAYLMILFQVLGDLFRDRGMSGLGKTLWIIFLIVLPYLSVFVYLIARGPRHGGAAPRGAERGEAGDRPLHQGGGREVGCRTDRRRESTARRRHHHPGRVRHPQGKGAHLTRAAENGRQATIRCGENRCPSGLSQTASALLELMYVPVDGVLG